MRAPLVSVIIPTFNRGGVIGTTIEDVFRQTYDNLELIVVDDGSTDDTQSVLKSYEGRIRWITQENAGPSAARNRGLAEANGEIIAFQDSDDLWHPTKIARQVALLQRVDQAVPCCVCSAEIRRQNRSSVTTFQYSLLKPANDEGLWLNPSEVLIDRGVLFIQTAAIRSEAIKKVGGFNEQLKFLEDYELPLRLAMLGPFGFIRDPLVIWNQGSVGSWSKVAYEDMTLLRTFEVKIREEVLRELGSSSDRKELRKQMESKLAKAKRLLWIARLQQTHSPALTALAYTLDRVEHYSDAAIRRSPWFIEMKTAPLPQLTGFPTS